MPLKLHLNTMKQKSQENISLNSTAWCAFGRSPLKQVERSAVISRYHVVFGVWMLSVAAVCINGTTS